MTDIPHFDMPFRIDPTTHLAVTEQDEQLDVQNCVEAILRTAVGERVELPEFGWEDLTFNVQPLDLTGIMQSIVLQEPRAILLFEQEPDFLDPLIAKITIKLDQAQEVT